MFLLRGGTLVNRKVEPLGVLAFAISPFILLFAAATAAASPYQFTTVYAGQNSQISGVAMNNSGMTAFEMTNGGVTGIYTGNGGAVTNVVNSTQMVTVYISGDGEDSPAHYQTFNYASIAYPGIDDSGHVYFGAQLYGYGAFSNSGGAITEVYNFATQYGYTGNLTVAQAYSDSGITAATTPQGATTVIANGVATNLPTTVITGASNTPFTTAVNNSGTVVGYSVFTSLVENQQGTWTTLLSSPDLFNGNAPNAFRFDPSKCPRSIILARFCFTRSPSL